METPTFMTAVQPTEIVSAHSPDSDDAFMFYALAHDKIDTGGLRFRPMAERNLGRRKD